ncbi:polysaccharide biosynthesis tyrosine autokinase [bacterium]|nr:polysaccharide biosynthesis tyrosine autokinase [bacterium]
MAEQGINPKEIGLLCIEKYPIILVAVAISMFISWKKADKVEPIYQAGAVIQVDYQQTSILSEIEQVDTQDFGEYDVLNTIVETISNTDLMRQVITDNDLLNNKAFAGKDAGSASLQNLARSLVRRTTASLREDTRLIDLTFKDKDRILAQKLVNWIANGYIKQHADRRLNINRVATRALTNEAERLKFQLRNAEVALIDFRRSSKLYISLQDRQGIVNDRIGKLNRELDIIQGNISKFKNDLALIKDYGTNPTSDMLRQVPSIIALDPVKDSYEEYLLRKTEFDSLSRKYRSKHPLLKAATKNLKDAKFAFDTVIKGAPIILDGEYRRKKMEGQGLQEQVTAAERESLTLSENAVEYNVLEREVTGTKTLYTSVLERIKEIDLTAGLQDEVITVIESASGATDVSGGGESAILMGAMFGLALGAGIIYLLHMMDTTLKSVDQAEQALELPALGAIPGSEPKNRLAKSRLVLLSDPSSSCAEAFRSLRANIESLGVQDKKITLFTSSMPAEGKTFTCINYAITLAQKGLRTIVIDLDLRHPSVGAEFSFTGNKLNVADILQDPRAFTQFTDENLENPSENLFVMPVGGQLPNPAEQLANQSITNLIRRATEQFDRVIIDSAPLNPVGDTLTIVQLVDVICMVVRCKKTPTRIIQRSLETLRRFNSPASGVILNFVPSKKNMGNYYYYGGSAKSPYDGARHYSPTTPTPSVSSPRTVQEESDIGTPAPKHRRRRIRRPEVQSESDENQVNVPHT